MSGVTSRIEINFQMQLYKVTCRLRVLYPNEMIEMSVQRSVRERRQAPSSRRLGRQRRRPARGQRPTQRRRHYVEENDQEDVCEYLSNQLATVTPTISLYHVSLNNDRCLSLSLLY